MDVGPEAVRRYVAQYTDDASKIRFAWNGEHGDQFDDANMVFRDAVVDCVIDDPARAPLELLVELYRALTEYSGEAWCIDERVEDIGKLMLIKGRSGVVRDYIIGMRMSFDALCATSFVGCPRDVAEECINHVRAKLQSETNDDEIDIWQTGEERFEVLLKHSV